MAEDGEDKVTIEGCVDYLTQLMIELSLLSRT